MGRLTETEKAQLLEEMWDTKKVILVCGRHKIAPGPDHDSPKPFSGCRDCWQVYWTRTVARIPPGERREWLEKIWATLRVMTEMVEKGTWDYQPFAHPKVLGKDDGNGDVSDD